jgi:septation ring formation regulator EzrA
MTAGNDLIRLAEEEAKTLDALSKVQALHQEAELLLDQANDDRELALAHISILEENYRVMKYAAPIVKIDSFAQTRDSLRSARARFTKVSGEVSYFAARLERLAARCEKLETDLQNICDKRTNSRGRIIAFRKPQHR